MPEDKIYVGLNQDIQGGMTETGKIIRDAWVFGLIDETEDCAGWTARGIEDLWQKVSTCWERYGFRVANLPPDLREKFMRIQTEAMERAKAAGWNPEMELEDD